MSASEYRGLALEELATALQRLSQAKHAADGNPAPGAELPPPVEGGRPAASKAPGMGALSEKTLLYGLRMLDRVGTGLRPPIRTDNAYERRLLPEVICPEDAGSGFAEVGALHDVKGFLP